MIGNLRTITGYDAAETLWRATVPPETVFDLWEVRAAFHRHFRRPIRFITGSAVDGSRLFLPLCRVEEKGCWSYFPGETWNGKTWLEQNRLFASGLEASQLAELLGGDFHLRYLTGCRAGHGELLIDETGYLFHPPAYRFGIENWWQLFRRKSQKNLRRELAAFSGFRCRIDQTPEGPFQRLVELNISRFGSSSYFADARFLAGFYDMLQALSKMGLLRMTSLSLGKNVVAVDAGSVYRGQYTLLAGGTDAAFPGVAKLINLLHLEWACTQQLDEVDFLCGDFLWKPLFHLTPRPLYLFTSMH